MLGSARPALHDTSTQRCRRRPAGATRRLAATAAALLPFGLVSCPLLPPSVATAVGIMPLLFAAFRREMPLSRLCEGIPAAAAAAAAAASAAADASDAGVSDP